MAYANVQMNNRIGRSALSFSRVKAAVGLPFNAAKVAIRRSRRKCRIDGVNRERHEVTRGAKQTTVTMIIHRLCVQNCSRKYAVSRQRGRGLWDKMIPSFSQEEPSSPQKRNDGEIPQCAESQASSA